MDLIAKLDSIKAEKEKRAATIEESPGSLPSTPVSPIMESAAAQASQLTSNEPTSVLGRLNELKKAKEGPGFISTVGTTLNNAAKASATMLGGLYQASSDTFGILDNWSKFISEKTGLDRSGIFGKLSADMQYYADKFDRLGIPHDAEADAITQLAYHLNSAVGKTTFDMPVIMATGMPAYSAVMGGGEAAGQEGIGTGQVIRATGEGLAHGLILHKIFSGLAPFSRGVQMSTGAIVMGGEELIQELRKPVDQRNFTKVIANTIVGAGMSAVGGSGDMKFRDAYNDLMNRFGADIEVAAGKLGVETRAMQRARAEEIAARIAAEKLTLEEQIARYEKEISEIPGVEQQMDMAQIRLRDKHIEKSKGGFMDIEFKVDPGSEHYAGSEEKLIMAHAFVEARYPRLCQLFASTHYRDRSIEFPTFPFDSKTPRHMVVESGRATAVETVLSGKGDPIGAAGIYSVRNTSVSGQGLDILIHTPSIQVKIHKNYDVPEYIDTITHELMHSAQKINWGEVKHEVGEEGDYPYNDVTKMKASMARGGKYMPIEVGARITGQTARARYTRELSAELESVVNELKVLKHDKTQELEALKLLYKSRFASGTSTEQKNMLSMDRMNTAARPPAEDVVEEVAGTTEYQRPKGDILSFTWRARSLESLLAKFPKGRKIAGDVIEAQLRAHHNIYTVDEAFFRQIEKDVPKKQWKHLRAAMEHLYQLRQTDPAAGQQLIDTDPVYKGANQVITYFENMKGIVIQYKKDMFQRQLSADMYGAFSDAINIAPANATATDPVIQSIAGSYRVQPADLAANVKQYRELERWGLSDFVTNIEVGSWRVLDSTGTVRAVGRTRGDAMRKAEKLRQIQPGIGDLTISTEFKGPVDPTKPRKDILLGEEDVMEALRTYSRSVRQKIEFDLVQEDMNKAFEADQGSILYPKNVRKALRKQLDDARFVHSWGDEVFDKLQTGFDIGGHHFKGFGGRPMGFTRLVQKTTNITANLKLGYRVVGSFVNFASGHGHTWVKNGVGTMTDAVSFMRTPEGKRFLIEEEPYLGLDFAATEAGKLHSKAPWYSPLGLFSAPEPGIRRLSLASNYLYARNKLGMTEDAARHYARQGVRAQSFTYNSAAIPGLLRIPGGKLIGQFQTYLVKELEFARSLTGVEWARYLTMQATLGGPRAMLAIIRSIPLLGAVGALDKIDEWLLKDKSGASSGLPGLVLGADISAAASFQIVKERVEDSVGPSLSELVRLYNTVLKPTLAGEKFNGQAAGEWLRNLAPIIRYWDALLQSTLDVDKNGQVWIRDRAKFRGMSARPMFKSVGERKYLVGGDWDRALMVAGAGSLAKARMQAADRIMARATQIDNNNRKKTSKIFLDAVQAGIPPDKDTIDALGMLGMDTGTLAAALKVREMTPEARAMFYSNSILKLKAAKLYLE